MVTLVNPNNGLREPNKFAGLSTDTKPTVNDYPLRNGDIFLEMDTRTICFYDAENAQWLGSDSPSDLTAYVGTAVVGTNTVG